MTYQQTISQSVSTSGVGLHSGVEVTITLKPAEEFTGIVFHRTDVTPGSGAIIVCADSVFDTELCTKIKNDYGVEVGTVEHIMAAFFALGIDNIIVELDGEEIPIMDGSSIPFVELIDKAGIITQHEPRKVIKIKREVQVTEGIHIARAKPAGEMSLKVLIDFAHPLIATKEQHFDSNELFFRKNIAPARTFCFEKDVKAMQKAGLAKGGSLKNAIVFTEDGLLNKDQLKFKDEPLRHKVLDCFGDFYMAGYRIIGKFELKRPGHTLNNKLLRTILANPKNWCWK